MMHVNMHLALQYLVYQGKYFRVRLIPIPINLLCARAYSIVISVTFVIIASS